MNRHEKKVLNSLEKRFGQKFRLVDENMVLNYGQLIYSINDKNEINGIAITEQGLTQIPDEIFELKNLENLEFYLNSFKEIPDEIVNLVNLKKLSFFANQIEFISEKIAKLQLVYLNLIDNNLKNIPNWFFSLKPQIYTLDTDIHQKKFKGIFIGVNPIEAPPIEIISQGKQSALNYLNTIKKDDSQLLNEIKIVLVGNGASGKTSLRKRLMNQDFSPQETQTHGINIDKWEIEVDKIKKIVANIWDFGGQEIMHATHQFFLSKRSIYLLVLNAREEPNPEYWLQHIKVFSGSSPIIIVINKIDENPGFDINRRFLENKYKNVIGTFKISCLTEEGIPKLKEEIKKSINAIPHLNTKWSKNWFKVKEALETYNKDFIEYENYITICKENEVLDSFSQSSLIEFLNDLGVVIFFNDFRLKHTQVLEPHWLTNGVYKVINSELLANKKGIISFEEFHRILNQKDSSKFKYPRSKHNFIFDLMSKFELCYEAKPNKILIPDLLQVQEPEITRMEDEYLEVLIKYDFLPKSILPRFMVRVGVNIYQDNIWRTGLIIKDEYFKSKALIRADYAKSRIKISIEGNQNRDFLSVILNKFQQIHKSYKFLGDDIRIVIDTDVSISYKHLLFLENQEIKNYIPEGAKKKYDVQKLLGTMQLGKKKEEEITQLLEKIITHLDDKESMLEKANDIIQLHPNIAGIGVNINALIDKIFDRKNKTTNKS